MFRRSRYLQGAITNVVRVYWDRIVLQKSCISSVQVLSNMEYDCLFVFLMLQPIVVVFFTAR